MPATTKFEVTPMLRACLQQDMEYKPLATGLTKWKDGRNVYFRRQLPGKKFEWIPMQGKKPKRPVKLPELASAVASGEPLLFDPAKFVQSGQRTSAV